MTVVSLDPFAPATTMLRALRERQVSAVELLGLHLRRIERHNLTLNALITPDFEAARLAAVAADAARARGDARPFLGLPLTVKDSIDVCVAPPACWPSPIGARWQMHLSSRGSATRGR